ncbi:MAG: hypothetical protein ABUJ98_12460 [Hyphomicrobium sp.]|jgi:hypothetical protein
MSVSGNLQSMLIRYLNCPELMDLMEERADVNTAEAAINVSSLAWFEAHSICIFCLHVGKCGYWLECANTRSTPGDVCSYSEFCGACAHPEAIESGQEDIKQAH